MRKLIIFLCLLTSTSIYPQQLTLKGQVSVHNSKYDTGTIEFVQNASIMAPFTKPATTDINGNFQLVFVDLDHGTSISLQAEKYGLEVVNQHDLLQVIISRKLPLRIYVTTKGKLAEAQTELYNISKKALFARKDALIARLSKDSEESTMAIAELEAFFGHPIKDREEAETQLMEKIRELEKRLPEFAQNLAMKNLDFANELYIEAYEHFQKGNIEAVIKTLDNSRLEDAYKTARETIAAGEELEKRSTDIQEKGRLQLQQIIDSYKLKAESYYLIFDYANVVAIYEKIVSIYSEYNLDELEMSKMLSDVGKYQNQNGQYEKSLNSLKRVVVIQEKLLQKDHPDLAETYYGLAMSYMDLGQYQKAEEYQVKAIEIRENDPNVSPNDLGFDYNNMGSIYSELGNYQEAEKYLIKSVSLMEKTLNPDDTDLAESYYAMAMFYIQLKQYHNAETYQLKATSIDENAFGKDHPTVAYDYQNMAMIYSGLKQYEKAESYQHKSLDIRKKIFGVDHPNVFYSYITLANLYSDIGKFQDAENYYLKSIVLGEKTLGAEHPNLTIANSNLASLYKDNGQFSKAMKYQIISLEIAKKVLPPNHPNIAVFYMTLSEISLGMNNIEAAIENKEKANSVIQKISEVNRGNLVKVYKDLSKKITEHKN